jgi:hypothetical protein
MLSHSAQILVTRMRTKKNFHLAGRTPHEILSVLYSMLRLSCTLQLWKGMNPAAIELKT